MEIVKNCSPTLNRYFKKMQILPLLEQATIYARLLTNFFANLLL